jgi:hypothetical protein
MASPLAELPAESLLEGFGNLVDVLAGRVEPNLLRKVVAPLVFPAKAVSEEHTLPTGWHPPLTLPNPWHLTFTLPILQITVSPSPPSAFTRLQERLVKRLRVDTSRYNIFRPL